MVLGGNVPLYVDGRVPVKCCSVAGNVPGSCAGSMLWHVRLVLSYSQMYCLVYVPLSYSTLCIIIIK